MTNLINKNFKCIFAVRGIFCTSCKIYPTSIFSSVSIDCEGKSSDRFRCPHWRNQND